MHLFALAADSMGGRQTGDIGDWKAQEWVAQQFARAGLKAAGEGGTFFQVIPFRRIAPDMASRISTSTADLAVRADFLPLGQMPLPLDGAHAVFGGSIAYPDSLVDSATAAGHLLVIAVPDSLRGLRRIFEGLGPVRQTPAYRASIGVAVVALDRFAPDIIPQVLAGVLRMDTTFSPPPGARPLVVITPAAASVLLGRELMTARRGMLGPILRGGIRYTAGPLPYPARNIIAVLPGSDSVLSREYVSISAHHDHVGFSGRPVDHDSVYAYNRVVRPMGADSPMRDATPEEKARVAAIRDSMVRVAPSRPDSVFNGADDDGSGTVGLVELARVLAMGPHPRRSILFVSHAAEERGLLGSSWFTDHPTVARDSIVGEVDMDMIGRGNATDLPKGGPGYLEVVGSKRLSNEYGALLERVNAGEAVPFSFNYEFDVPGHPLQYYCRADHYSYARFGIPAVALSRGEHADYHQVTDEPQYIDYGALAHVATLVRDFTLAVANLDHRPVVDGVRQADPHGPCRQ
ncbi:MAG TPA: M28 family peptidase [Gemmatimonadales bacterium]|nr:M28 family peptidase [Gemmatimonadales bacterium]